MPCGISEAVAAALITAAAGAATTGATLASQGDNEPRYVPVSELKPDDFEKQLAQKAINIEKQPNLSLGNYNQRNLSTRNFNQPRRLSRF